MARRYQRRPAEVIPEPEWTQLLEEALTAPGRRGETYIRGHEYSYLNQLRLYLQGVREPTTGYEGWKKLGRHVLKGSKGYTVVRPIMRKSKTEVDEHGQPLVYPSFTPVRGAFTYSQTEGEPLPDALTELPEWSVERAMGVLGITRTTFEDVSLNKQGYSYERMVAINPTAVYPLKTTWHEMAHIEAGHTTQDHEHYEQHRGLFEFEAEGTAYLGMHELGLDEQMNPAESRAYIQGWLQGDTPPDSSIRKVFKITDTILKAGYVYDDETEDAIAKLKAAGVLSDAQ